MTLTPTKNWSHKFVPKFSIDLQLWDNLNITSIIVLIWDFGVMKGLLRASIISQLIIRQHIQCIFIQGTECDMAD